MVAPVLIFAVGNESRGDDALGPLLLRRIQEQAPDSVECLEDFQLQVEHSADLLGRRQVVFVDADVSCESPFSFSELEAAHDHSYSSHAQSPAALLHTFKQVYADALPQCYVLGIRGYGFELGEDLSPEAADNLEQATAFLRSWLVRSVEVAEVR
ncbi:MAG: hydrogenase maturation protease [Gammaproteobacteria bacterium]|nr:hydrogenase maturation protease [Gammaproteobacteria bacterium]MBU1625155.1 hydrogenase maturation protease [Gammaproteobacteria bacterium]MBU1981415.1 hydrogenase maturation protease [Gammaproteobacteria bacterium]